MEQRSFEKYLETKYYDPIFYRVLGHFNRVKDRMYLHSYAVPDPTRIWLDSICIEKAFFREQKDNDWTYFKLKVRGDIVLSGKRDCDFEKDQIYKYFSVLCKGIFFDGLHHFEVYDIEEYDPTGYNYHDQLSSLLLPYISVEDLESRAEAFLKKYCPEALKEPMPLPIKDILTKMEATLFHAPLAKNIFGKTLFFRSVEKIYDDDMEIIEREVPKRAILINPNVYFYRNIGAYNNTIIHECVHLEYHTHFFEINHFDDETLTSISCKENYSDPKAISNSAAAYERMEFQAAYLAPRILMPAQTTIHKFAEIRDRLAKETINPLFGDIMSTIIDELSDFFKVSRQAAKIRLVDLGIMAAVGVDNYVNGKKYSNFSFSKDSLKRNQTFLIDFLDLARTLKTHPFLRELSIDGKIVYADGALVINDQRYVYKNQAGERLLTPYALNHMDECAFIFEKQEKKKGAYSEFLYSQFFLCRGEESGSYLPASYSEDAVKNKELESTARQAKSDLEDIQEALEVLKKMTGPFSNDLYVIADFAGLVRMDGTVNINQFAELTKIDNHTLSGYLSGGPTLRKEKILSICAGLKLHPRLSYQLLKRAGFDITSTGNEDDMIYCGLLEQKYSEGIDAWNYYLKSINKMNLIL